MTVSNDKLFGCPYCGFRVGPGDERCSRYGNKFGPSTKFECPFCGDLVALSTLECPSCHVDFAEFQTRVRKTAKTDGVDILLMEIIRLEATEVALEGKSRVEAALVGAGFKPQPFRLDLRGLEVEEG